MHRLLPRLIVICGCAGLLLAGCAATPDTSPESMGQPVQVDGGIAVRVPALWVDVGTNASGIEPAEVWVNANGTPGFAVHLDSVRATGAGPAWKAASASAAAVATLLTGADPSRMDIDFTITGPIDGPSAGAILTVGLLAALQQVPLKPGISMTGTIAPDGSIGRVLGIPQKLRAAAASGYHTVIIPSSITTIRDDQTGAEVNAETYGRSVGIKVMRMSNVRDAYGVFTDQPLLPQAPRAYRLPPKVQEASSMVSASLIEQADRLIEQTSRLQDRVPVDDQAPLADGLDQATDQMRQARSALAGGDATAAYGRATDASLQAARMIAGVEAQTRLQSGGVEATRQWLLDDIATLRTRIASTIARSAMVEGLPVEQQFAVPTALGWLTYSDGVLGGIQNLLTGPQALPSSELFLAASAIADQRLSLDAQFPSAMTIVRSMPSTHPSQAQQVASFLDGYSDFLVRAADANLGYADAVLAPGTPSGSLLSTSRQQDPSFRLLESTVKTLARQADGIKPGAESIEQEVIDAAHALSHFVASGSLIAAIQDFSMVGFGIGEDADMVSSTSLNAAVNSGAATVSEFAALLAADGYDSGYAAWSAAWGTAAWEALSAQDRAGAGAVLALNEIWYANVNVFWTHAYALRYAGE